MRTDAEKRKEDLSALLRILALEGIILAAAVGVYLYTNNMTYLIGGVVGAQIVVVPMILRWARERAGGGGS